MATPTKPARAKSSKKTTRKTVKATPRRAAPSTHSPTKFSKAKDSARSASMQENRTDLNQPGSVAIDRLPEPKRSLARLTDQLIRRLVPTCDCVVKWGNPVYSVTKADQRTAFAAIMETKLGLNLALPGVALSDPHHLLEGTGKLMRHIKLKDPALLSNPAVARLIKAAVKVGLPGM
jgi:hypothetical protein